MRSRRPRSMPASWASSVMRELAGVVRSGLGVRYPSLWEGFGLPVAEAMAQGTPVITSRETSMAEVAGGAAVLVDPLDVDDIARGLTAALEDHDRLRVAGLARAAELTWEAAAAATRAGVRRGPSVTDRGRREPVVVHTRRGRWFRGVPRPPARRSWRARQRRRPHVVLDEGVRGRPSRADRPIRGPNAGRPGWASLGPDRRRAHVVGAADKGFRHRPPRRRHGAARRVAPDPADRARPAVPRAPAILLAAAVALPAGDDAAVRRAARPSSPRRASSCVAP